ncbi:MAG: cysteine desulfurase [Clostridiales bacterium]|nr:cysteine desulfurase [Clostridiales bacterium]
MKEQYGNAGTLYRLGRTAAKAVEKARSQVAALINAKPEQIIFTSGGTEANNLVFFGLQGHLSSIGKKHVIVSAIEHDSVIHAVEELCAKHSFCADLVYPEETGVVSAEAVEEELEWGWTSAGLVSVMHTNNETGVQNPVEEIAAICHEHGVLFHTDCVQAATHPLDVNQLGCDFLSLSSHKIHGPKGVGALYVRDTSLLSPLICGGDEQEFGLRGGTENVAGIVGFGKACEILKEQREDDEEYTENLCQLLYERIWDGLFALGLKDILWLNGDNEDRPSKVLNLGFRGVDSETLVLLLDSDGLCISAGSACRSHESEPSRVLTAMGVDAEDARNSVRFSLSRMNTVEEIIEAAQMVVVAVAMLHQSST